MYQMIDGSRFIGYGRVRKCQHCNNSIIEHIYCSYSEHRALFVTIPYLSSAYAPVIVCPICKHMSPDFYGVSNMNAEHKEDYDLRAKNVNDFVRQVLDSGKAETRKYFNTLNYFQKKSLFRDLKNMKYYFLIDYIENPI